MYLFTHGIRHGELVLTGADLEERLAPFTAEELHPLCLGGWLTAFALGDRIGNRQMDRGGSSPPLGP
jgi:hypothetical protein